LAGNPNLIESYRQIHATSEYGNTSVKNLRFLRPEIKLLRPASIIDYGCGQSQLLDLLELGYPVARYRYDPAIPQYSKRPERSFELLLNIDVLEHIEEADLDEVLAEMRSLCRDAIIIVDTKEAVAKLEDGRNAHVTLRPHGWWRERIGRHFGHIEPIATVRRTRAGFKTWHRGWDQAMAYLALRAEEEGRYLKRRISGNRRAS